MVGDFEAAVDRLQRKICTLAAYMLGDRAEADDVTQEVLIKMWSHWKRLERESLQAWALRVTRNACIDRLRTRSRRRRHEAARTAEGFLERAPDAAPGPAAVVEGIDLGRRLAAELTALAEPYRSIVILREVEGLKYREIAAAMEMPLGTIKVYLHRGRQQLRRRLSCEESHVSRA